MSKELRIEDRLVIVEQFTDTNPRQKSIQLSRNGVKGPPVGDTPEGIKHYIENYLDGTFDIETMTAVFPTSSLANQAIGTLARLGWGAKGIQEDQDLPTLTDTFDNQIENPTS
jgi:hypothetical protein